MSTTVAEPSSHTSAHATAAERLRAGTTAVRRAVTWFGVRKSLTAEQKALAAETFGAQQRYVSPGKNRLDSRHWAFNEVTGLKQPMIGLWQGATLPFPEPGIHLINTLKAIKAGHLSLDEALHDAAS